MCAWMFNISVLSNSLGPHGLQPRLPKCFIGKEPPANAGDTGDVDSIPGLVRSPGEETGNPLQYSCLVKSHGQRSLVDYNPWGRKELDTTDQLSMQAYTDCSLLGSSVHGIFQARVCWGVFPYPPPWDLLNPEIQPVSLMSHALVGRFSSTGPTWVNPQRWMYQAQLLSCVRLWVIPWTVAGQAPLSMGILQGRKLEWVAMYSSRGSSQSRDRTQVSCITGGLFTF